MTSVGWRGQSQKEVVIDIAHARATMKIRKSANEFFVYFVS
jgi:phosphopantetheinyl transferase